MTTLHVVLSSGELVLYALSDDAGSDKGVWPNPDSRGVHPQALAAPMVRRVSAVAGVRALDHRRLTVWLPEQGRLEPWTVPALPVSGDVVLALLAHPVELRAAERGSGFAWLAQVEQATTELVRHGYLVPRLPVQVGSRQPASAALQLWVTPPVQQVLDALAEALPARMISTARPLPLGAGGQVDEQMPVQAVDVARCAVELLAPAVCRRELAGGVAFDGRGLPHTARDLLAAFSGARTANGQPVTTVPVRPTSARFGELLEQYAVLPGPGSRTRLVLTLLPPDVPDQPWLLRCGLRDLAQPDVVVALADHRERANELLAAARELFAPLAAVSPGRPQLELDLDAVVELVGAAGQSLLEAGVVVVLPDGLAAPARVNVRLRSRRGPSSGLLGLETLLAFDLQAHVDGENVDVQAAADAASPLLYLGGRWVLVDRSSLGRLQKLARRLAADGGLEAGELVALLAAEDEAPEVDVANNEWLARLLAGGVPHDLAEVELPDGLAHRLSDGQRSGVAWLGWLTRNGFGGILADPMGTGKTLQLLSVLAAEKSGGLPAAGGPTLVVAPVIGLNSWRRDIAKFGLDLQVVEHYGAGRAADAEALAAAAAQADVVLTSHMTAVSDAEVLTSLDWHRVVIDEAHRIKNWDSRASKFARGVRARHRIAVSGTPVHNSAADLHSLMSFANPGLLGSRGEFSARYLTPIGAATDEATDGRVAALERLSRAVAPFVLQRDKNDQALGLDLPDKTVRTVACSLTDEQVVLYRKEQEDLLARIEEHGRKGFESLHLIRRLKQVLCHPALLPSVREVTGPALAGRSGKLDELDRILLRAGQIGAKTLVFTQYRTMADLLVSHLQGTQGRPVFAITGALSESARLQVQREFTEAQGPAVLVLTYGAGGEAMDLIAATQVVLYDLWWNPAVEQQAIDRAHRIGQQRPVTVHRLVCQGTLEDRIERLLEGKRALADAVVSPAAQLRAMDAGQLRELTALDALQVGQGHAAA